MVIDSTVTMLFLSDREHQRVPLSECYSLSIATSTSFVAKVIGPLHSDIQTQSGVCIGPERTKIKFSLQLSVNKYNAKFSPNPLISFEDQK
jgi:hypothetical protein